METGSALGVSCEIVQKDLDPIVYSSSYALNLRAVFGNIYSGERDKLI